MLTVTCPQIIEKLLQVPPVLSPFLAEERVFDVFELEISTFMQIFFDRSIKLDEYYSILLYFLTISKGTSC